MKIKSILVVAMAVVLMAFAVSGCGKGEDTNTTSPAAETGSEKDETESGQFETIESIPEPEETGKADQTEQPSDGSGRSDTFDYSTIAGYYNDSYSQRAGAMVEATTNGARIQVDWSDSASSFVRWEMTLHYEGNGVFSYSDCTKIYMETDDSGNDTEQVMYTGGEGSFVWDEANGTLSWSGASEESCQPCVFEMVHTGSSVE